MTFTNWLVVLSAILAFLGSSAYIRDTLKGKTKPNRVTWLMWALAPLIGTAAAVSADANLWVTFRVFLSGFFPLIIFFVSFINPQSFWKLTTFDLLCGACSLLALIVWLGLGNPQSAILLAVVGDGFAVLPTVRKSWTNPETETGITYVTGLAATLLVLPSIPIWNIENSAFPIYLLVANVLLIFAVYRRRIRLQSI
jgi:hypothetical protein